MIGGRRLKSLHACVREGSGRCDANLVLLSMLQ